jgi:hypothetical protein
MKLPMKENRRFKLALKRLNTIPNINRGGCLVAAYHLHLRFGCQIVHLDYMDYDVKGFLNNQAFINGNSKKASSAYHFAVTFDKGMTLYDSRGKLNPNNYTTLLIPNEKTKEFVQNSLKNGCWNPMFNRKYLPKLIKL